MSVSMIVLELDDRSQEAILQICEGDISLIAFSCPFGNEFCGDEITLNALFAQNICRTTVWQTPSREVGTLFGQHIVAEVVDRKEGVVRLGSIYIYLDAPIPGDINNGEYVSFGVNRLDY